MMTDFSCRITTILIKNTETTNTEIRKTWGDRIWGTVDGKGANNLGIILMAEMLKPL